MSEDQESDAIIYTRVTATRKDDTHKNTAPRPECDYITTIATVLSSDAQVRNK